MKKHLLKIICALMVVLAVGGAQADETAIFTSVAPDALIVLDLSGSMSWNPAGGSNIYGDSTCAGPFYSSSGSGHTVDCSRLAIAKRAIANVLDDNGDGTIDAQDESTLGIRIGFMRYRDAGGNDDGDYSTGSIRLVSGKELGVKYSCIFCNNKTSCSTTTTSCVTSGGDKCSTATECAVGEYASGGTPLAAALNEAKLYLDANKAADNAGSCRKKFVIMMTDGSDTYACGGNGAEYTSGSYKRRRESVAQAKALKEAGYQTFIVGFGSGMPDIFENTLNWMAYYGGTDNPLLVNTGSTTGYSIASGAANLFPTGVTSCMSDTSAACTGSGSTSYDCATTNEPGTASLAGYAFLAGNATQLSQAMRSAIDIIREATYSFSQASVQSSRTQDENYLYEGSFQPVENESFWLGHLKKYQINSDGSVGSVIWDAGSVLQSAVSSECTTTLTSAGSGCRNILTYKRSRDSGTGLLTGTAELKKFTTSNIATEDLYTSILYGNSSACTADTTNCTGTNCNSGFCTVSQTNCSYNCTSSQATMIVGFIRGDSTYNLENWKLGDIFRATPITVGTPSAFYDDARDTNKTYSCGTTTSINAFAKHRCDHCRAASCATTTEQGNRLIVAGANDGQFHAFKTTDGSEAWSFVPPNLMLKLKNIAHNVHPTTQTHAYFVDGPVTVADVWWSAGSSGTSKTSTDWHTILAFGEGRGASSWTWSSSQYCDEGFSATYSTSYPYYCGYWIFDITDPITNVSSKTDYPTASKSPWRINPGSTLAPYIGEPWNKFMTGRVLIKTSGSEEEKWAAFVGAGYNAADCSGGGTCDTRGKGFYVVDISNGNILWSYTHADNADMDYSLPGTAAIVDTDNDSFVDTVYIGDLGGTMWRFKMCTKAMLDASATCNTGNWTGSKLFGASTGTIRPIYTIPVVAKDSSGNMWVQWGTGDKVDPTASNAQEKFFAVKDNNRTTTYSINDLDNITSAGSTYDTSSTTKVGYYINLSGSGEKILADPTVFGGVAYFTSYVPASGNNPCDQGGASYLYAINMVTGGPVFSSGSRSMSVGSGISSAPIISMRPGGSSMSDLYVTVSGGSGTSANTTRINFNPPGVSNRTNILYWKDKRLE